VPGAPCLINLQNWYIRKNINVGRVSGVTRNFVRGVLEIQLRTEDRENGDLRAVAAYLGSPLNLQMSETRLLSRWLQMYFPRNWEFCSDLSKLRNMGGGGVEHPPSYTIG
jgi:hypothetical protein